MDVQHCMPNRKYLETPTVLIRLIIPFCLIAFHSPFMRLDVALDRRFVIESSIITWLGLTGVVHKRSAAARRSVPFVSRNLRGYLHDSTVLGTCEKLPR